MVRISNMEHAVPQNITSFQFHLVGDMTLKQFGYLALGMIIAYISYVVILPLSPLVAIPLIGVSGSLGAAFAFIPIGDRALDHWVKAFFKAVFSPTLASWKPPAGSKYDPKDPVFTNRLGAYLSLLGINPPQVKPVQISRIQPAQPIQPPPAPQLQPLPAQNPPAENKVEEMAKYIAKLEEEVSASRTKIQQYQTSIPQPQPAAQQLPTQVQPVIPAAPQVKVVETPQPQLAPIMLTSFPNVINGIITDTAGNYLEGVIISIHDKNSLPVRALKSNKLGQFAGATPLSPGIYTVTFEKENLDFETLQVELNDSVLNPLKIQAKKGGA